MTINDTKFSWVRIGKIIGAILIIAAVLGTGYAVATSRQAKIAWAGWTTGAREHFLPCEDLPFNMQVKKAVSEHADVISKIQEITGAAPEAREIRCKIIEGGSEFIKGELQISYKSKQQRKEVEKLIGDNFFGMPWTGKQAGN